MGRMGRGRIGEHAFGGGWFECHQCAWLRYGDSLEVNGMRVHQVSCHRRVQPRGCSERCAEYSYSPLLAKDVSYLRHRVCLLTCSSASRFLTSGKVGNHHAYSIMLEALDGKFAGIAEGSCTSVPKLQLDKVTRSTNIQP